ncbi:MAG: MFS transporter [Pseudomonadota bacterium]
MTRRSRAKLMAAGTIGNVLEFYDFAIYGFFAISLGRTFFPGSDEVAQVLAAFGVFAVGFLMRPLGGAVTGYIGDRYGRRTALTFSVTAMAVPTFLVGLLPGYQTLGIMAPVLLVVLRAVQGLSVGGEYATSFTFMVENAPPGRAGLTAAIGNTGAVLGMLLGSGAGTLLASILSPAALDDWGWRLPFLAGLVVGVTGYLLRRDIEEIQSPRDRSHAPVAEVFRHHKRLVAQLAGLPAFGAVGYYLMFVYVVSWLQLVDGLPPDRALGLNTVGMAALVPVAIGAGWLGDRIGCRKVLTIAVVLGLFGAVPFLWLMHHEAPALIMLGQLGFVLVAGSAAAVQPVLLVESAPRHIRCTTVAISYNLSYGLLGGTAPMAATWLIQRTTMDLSPAFLVVAAAIVSLIAIATFRTAAPAHAATAGPLAAPAPAEGG